MDDCLVGFWDLAPTTMLPVSTVVTRVWAREPCLAIIWAVFQGKIGWEADDLVVPMREESVGWV